MILKALKKFKIKKNLKGLDLDGRAGNKQWIEKKHSYSVSVVW